MTMTDKISYGFMALLAVVFLLLCTGITVSALTKLI